MSAKPFLLYLHGFLSSPRSQKAEQTLHYCEKIGLGNNIAVPTLRHGPARSIAELRTLIEDKAGHGVMLMGSSLGGYYATCLAEEYDLPAVLINPAVRPFEFWQTHVGEHRNFHTDEIHRVTEDHIDELRQLDKSPLSRPENFRVYLQTGDETLDFRQAVSKFGEAHCIVRDNGNHSYENYVSELPAMFDFLLSRIGHSVR